MILPVAFGTRGLFVLAARWQGTAIGPGVENLPVGIVYVVDQSVLNDGHLDFAKCVYVAIGISTETESGTTPKPLRQVLAGSIARAFGTGKLRLQVRHLTAACSGRALPVWERRRRWCED